MIQLCIESLKASQTFSGVRVDMDVTRSFCPHPYIECRSVNSSWETGFCVLVKDWVRNSVVEGLKASCFLLFFFFFTPPWLGRGAFFFSLIWEKQRAASYCLSFLSSSFSPSLLSYSASPVSFFFFCCSFSYPLHFYPSPTLSPSSIFSLPFQPLPRLSSPSPLSLSVQPPCLPIPSPSPLPSLTLSSLLSYHLSPHTPSTLTHSPTLPLTLPPPSPCSLTHHHLILSHSPSPFPDFSRSFCPSPSSLSTPTPHSPSPTADIL